MKNSLTAILPALGLLALSGCAGTGAIATSEDDGVYYSSKDHTTAVARPAKQTYNQPYASGSSAPATSAPAATDEATNPDYNGSTGTGTASDQYYDDSNGGYSTKKVYPNGVPNYDYYTPGVTSYVPVAYAPYTVIAPSPYLYSPYGYSTVWADPFYNPYYSPYYGYGSGVSISIGFGRPWGYGYGGWGSPWGYGYGGGYSPYYYGGPFYSGYYGYGGYYGNGYYGGGYRDVIYTGSGNYGGGGGRTVLVGPRRGRGGDVTGGRPAGGRTAGYTTGTGSTNGGGRAATGGRPAGTPIGTPSTPTGGRAYNNSLTDNATPGRTGRTVSGTRDNGAVLTTPAETGGVRPATSGGGRAYGETRPETTPNVRPTYVEGMTTQPAEPRTGRTRSGWGGGQAASPVAEQPQAQPQVIQPQVLPQGEATRTRRGGFFGGGQSQPAQQPQPSESRARSYEQPTYSQPSQPSRSYSPPSGGGGGGSFGGGGGGGGRRGR